MEVTDRLSNFPGDSSSLASNYDAKALSLSARPVHPSEQYAEYSFTALLGLAQRLHVRFLPITWQVALGRIGKGGQAGINQALVDVQTSFAFKLFDHPQ